jgi:hypothetical protein
MIRAGSNTSDDHERTPCGGGAHSKVTQFMAKYLDPDVVRGGNRQRVKGIAQAANGDEVVAAEVAEDSNLVGTSGLGRGEESLGMRETGVSRACTTPANRIEIIYRLAATA